MASSTVENYIKQIFLLRQRGNGKLVALGQLAETLGVVPGTVTTMVKALDDAGLVKYQARQGVRLTPAGDKLALHVLRRHRLIELFLVRILGFDWADVHAEAEELEHVISEKLLERIDEYLGRPAFDPHGDPIPSAGGRLSDARLAPLTKAHPGRKLRIGRVVDQDSAFLHYANDHGLVPGAAVTIIRVDPVGDSLTVKIPGREPLSLGATAAGKILVEPSNAQAERP